MKLITEKFGVNVEVAVIYAVRDGKYDNEESALWGLMRDFPVKKSREHTRQYRALFIQSGWTYAVRDIGGMLERPVMQKGWLSPSGKFYSDDFAVDVGAIKDRIVMLLQENKTIPLHVLEIADILYVRA